MFRALRRAWKYLGAKLNLSFDKNADPEVQINQAIDEAKFKHRELAEQAATVVGTYKQAQMDLDKALKSVADNKQRATKALELAQKATADGDTATADSWNQAAEVAGQALMDAEAQVEDLKATVLNAASAAQMAKQQVDDHAAKVHADISRKNKLLGKLAQAKMQETLGQLKTSMSSLAIDDVPTLDEVEDKINNRFAMASGQVEIASGGVENRLAELDRATRSSGVQERLAALKAEMAPVAIPAKTTKAKTNKAKA